MQKDLGRERNEHRGSGDCSQVRAVAEYNALGALLDYRSDDEELGYLPSHPSPPAIEGNHNETSFFIQNSLALGYLSTHNSAPPAVEGNHIETPSLHNSIGIVDERIRPTVDWDGSALSKRGMTVDENRGTTYDG
ncbi:hypothetical protein C8R42DRAFT_726407 [Lentinula raphanica]|nr:hypothetical protein C8R42DRAFT_726407 [Lentinula raphanica]